MDKYVKVLGHSVSHTDIVRVFVILSLSLSCIFITAISLERQVGAVYTQLFYFPIIYATYFYPKKGLYLAGICALAFELLSYFYVYPNAVDLISTTGQAILFILVAVVVAYFTEKVNTSEARYRSIFESSLMGIILFDQNTFAIRMTNGCVEQMLGYTEEELRSMNFSSLFSTPEEQRVFYERLGSNADITNFETRLLTKSKEPLWVASLLAAGHRKHGEHVNHRHQQPEAGRTGRGRELCPVQAGDRELPDEHPHPAGREDCVHEPVLYPFLRLCSRRSSRKRSPYPCPRRGPGGVLQVHLDPEREDRDLPRSASAGSSRKAAMCGLAPSSLPRLSSGAPRPS